MNKPLLGEMVAERVFDLATNQQFWKFGIIIEKTFSIALTERVYIIKWLDTKQEQSYDATDIFKMKCDVPFAKKEYL